MAWLPSPRLIELVTGIGHVSRESRGDVGHRRYFLSVWEDVHDSRTATERRSDAAGSRDVHGSVEFETAAAPTDLDAPWLPGGNVGQM
jgi:hypothetical protein